MTTVTAPGLEPLHREVANALGELRKAREHEHEKAMDHHEERLNYLLDRLGQAYASVKVSP